MRWRELGERLRASPRGWLVGTTVAVYLAAAMTSNYNLSVRHLLPILPFVYLPIARFVAARRWWTVVVLGVLAAEAIVLSPLWMSATNTWWLGAANPTRFALGAGNLEARQNFVELARGVEKRGLEPLTILYPALTPEVLESYLPGARLVDPLRGETEIPPGWVAVNVTTEQLVPALLAAEPEDVYFYDELHRAAELWQPVWNEVTSRGEDHGWIAGTFHLYRIPGQSAPQPPP